MKHFFLALLLTTTICASGDHEAHTHRFTHVFGTDIIDGQKPPLGINGDIIAKILSEKRKLHILLRGEKKQNSVFKPYTYQGISITLIDLITIFEQLERDNVDHNDPRYHDAVNCLNIIIDDFIKVKIETLEKESDSKFLKATLGKIIHNWAHKSNRNHSLLLNWGKPNEEELFRKVSAAQLGQFSLDLDAFLQDLMFSCPKAREQFKNKYITETRYGGKYIEKRATFDHSFQAHN